MWFDGKYIKIERLDNPECDMGNMHAVLVIKSQADEVVEYLGANGAQHSGILFKCITCPEYNGSTVYLQGTGDKWDGSPLIVPKDRLDKLRAAFCELNAAIAKRQSRDGEVIEIDGRKYELSLVN